jgi:hypothetical protein
MSLPELLSNHFNILSVAKRRGSIKKDFHHKSHSPMGMFRLCRILLPEKSSNRAQMYLYGITIIKKNVYHLAITFNRGCSSSPDIFYIN